MLRSAGSEEDNEFERMDILEFLAMAVHSCAQESQYFKARREARMDRLLKLMVSEELRGKNRQIKNLSLAGIVSGLVGSQKLLFMMFLSFRPCYDGNGVNISPENRRTIS